MATSQELYEIQKQHQRYGMTYGATDRLLAAVESGEMTVEEAFPPTGPANPMMTFGGSNLSSGSTGSQNRFGQLLGSTQTATQGTTTGSTQETATEEQAAAETQAAVEAQVAAEEQAAQEAAYQELLANQDFIALLHNLGLTNLVNLFSSTPAASVATPAAPTYVPQGMMTSPQFGVAPVRLGYLPPLVVNPASISEQTGLLQYVQNQG